MAFTRIRMLVNGQPATGPGRTTAIHHSQTPPEVSRAIGLRALDLQREQPDAEVIDVEVGDLLLPRSDG